MRKTTLIFIIWLVASGIAYYFLTEPKPEIINAKVLSVIDGDTIEISTGQKVRFLGINTPEKGMPNYLEAKNFLKKLLENRTIRLEVFSKDRYGRLLAHVFYGKTHINEEILRNGLAHLFYYEKDDYFEDLKEAESLARKKGIGIWKPSKNAGCIKLISLKYEESPRKRCSNSEELILENLCNKTIEATIKDSATHIYKEKIEKGYFKKNFSCVFNDEGDSLFVSDKSGLLLFYRYSGN